MRKLDNRGSVPILVCILITGLLAFTSYVIDIGMVYIEKIRLSNAIDAAALAAVMELPNNRIYAKTVAIEFLEKNNVSSSDADIIISSDNKSIEIEGVKSVSHLFAKVIGIESSEVHAKTKAEIIPTKVVKSGVRPFAVESNKFTFGELITLKEGAGNGYHGNYGAVALGGFGANVFRGNALYGYKGTISVGDYIDTEPGNMAGVSNEIKNLINSENSTFESFQRGSIRVWTIPIVDSLKVNGRKKVLVLGFGQFYVESIEQKSGKIEINGRFIRYVVDSEGDKNLSDTGSYGARLSR